MLDGHADELEADFQQFYGLDLYGLLDAGSWRRARALAQNLPATSRLSRALQPANSWGDAEYLLAYIADNIAYQRYENAVANGSKRAKKPKPVKRPEAAVRKRPVRPDERTVHGMSSERVGEILSRPRG